MRSIPLFKVSMSPEVSEPLNEVLMSGYIGQGEQVDAFEEELSHFIGNPYVNTVNSATSALTMAIRMLRGDDHYFLDDEVLTTPLTCTATNLPIMANNMKIKWVDVDPETCNIDTDDLMRKLSPKTKIIMVVHWGGYPCDLDRLVDVQERCQELYGFKPGIIEDCAHAPGSSYKGKLLGNHGNLCCYSFQAIKHITTGDGGMLVSPSHELHKKAQLLRWYGLDRTRSADFRCLHPNTLVRLADGTTKRISNMVKDKDPGPILTYSDGKLVSKNVIGWHKNSLSGRKFLSISTRNLFPQYQSVVTEDHQILTKVGWKLACELSPKDKVATSFPEPSKIQREILVGSLLGDGCITTKQVKTVQRATFFEQHTAVDEEYVRLKAKSLAGLNTNVFYSPPDNKNKRPNGSYGFSTKTLPSLSVYRNKFYPDGKKIVSKELVLNNFSKLMLCCWYLDDGHTKVVNQREGLVVFAQLSTNSFLEEDVSWLVSLLNEKGYQCRSGNHSGWRIFFTKEGSEKLLSDIAPFVPNSMRYKVGHLPRYAEFNENLWGDGTSSVFFDVPVVEDFENKGYKSVYCLEIDGSSSSFATSSVIVHNCEQNIQHWGYKFHMNDINATIGRCNLKLLPSVLTKHQENGSYFNKTLLGVPGVNLLKSESDRKSSYWVYTMKVEDRDGFIKKMKENGIAVSRVHDRNDKHRCFQDFKCGLPNLDKLCESMICIPCGWWVENEDREYIVDCIKKGW